MKFLFTLFTLFALSAGAQTTSKTLGGNYPSGFSGFRNYIKNPGGEIDAQNVSVAGTNGTIGVFSNNPITNKKSFRVGGNLNTNITATFTADPFDQGLADSSNSCAAALNLQPNGTGTYTINVKLGSTTVATRSFTTTTAIPVQYQTFVYSCGTLSQTPTIDVVANLTSGSGTDHFQADDIYMGQDPGFIGSMKISTQEQTYTPTYTGFGSVLTSNMKWYQDGAYIYVYGSFVSGTPTGVEARMSIPSGYTSASTISTLILCGDASRDSNSTTYFRNTVLCEPNVSYITFGAQTSTANAVTKSLANSLVGAGSVVYVNAKIPISGASNINATTSACLQDGSCLNTFSAKISAAGVVSDENIDFIQGNCALSSNIHTCTWVSSRFPVAPNCTVTAIVGPAGTATISSVSTTAATITPYIANTGVGNSGFGFTLSCSRAGSDYKPVMQAPWVSGSVTSNSTGPLRDEYVFFTGGGTGGICNSSPCTITAAISTSGWATVTRASTGAYTINYSGAFSSLPVCSFFTGNTTDTTIAATLAMPTSTSTTFTTRNLSATLTDVFGAIRCIGPR